MVTKFVNHTNGSETYFRTVSGFGEGKRDYSCTVSANFESQVGDNATFLYPFISSQVARMWLLKAA